MTYQAEVLADSPVVYYGMGDPPIHDAGSHSGNSAYDLHPIGTPTGVTGALGDASGARHYNGSSQASYLAGAALAGASGDPFTVELFIKIDSYGTGDEEALEINGGSAWWSSGGIAIDVGNTSEANTISFGMHIGSWLYRATIPRSTIPVGEWHHLALVFTPNAAASEFIKVYVDGVKQTPGTHNDSGTATTGALPGSCDVTFGARGTGSPPDTFALYQACAIDEFAFYAGELSATRIAAHVSAIGGGSSGGVAPSNTVAPHITPTTGVSGSVSLTCTTGTWSGDATITYAFQWKRDGTNISGATSATYVTQTPADDGHALTCAVTATNGTGSASATSNSVTPTAPSSGGGTPPPPTFGPGVQLAVLVNGAWVGLRQKANVDNNEFCIDDYVDSSGDDTLAIRQCVADAVQHALTTERYHARVLASARKYVLGAAAQKIGPCYAQVPIPPVPETGMKVILDLIGGSEDAGTWNHWNQTIAQEAGAVFESTLTSTGPDSTYGPPSIIGGPQAQSLFTAAGMTSGWSNMLVNTKGIQIVAPPDAGTVGLNLLHVAMANVENFGYMGKQTRSWFATHDLTNDQTVALLLPIIGNNDYVRVGSVGVYGAFWGMNLTDHLAMERGGFIYCRNALYTPGLANTHFHGAYIGNLSVEAGKTVLNASMGNTGGFFPLFVGMCNTELQNIDVPNGVTDFIDPHNCLRGQVYWTENTPRAATKVGATGLTITDLFGT